GSRRQLLRRLQLLFHHGFLERPRCQIDYFQSGSRPLVYGIGNKAVSYLRQESMTPLESYNWRDNQTGRLFLEHSLLILEFMVALEIACRKRKDVRFVLRDRTSPGGVKGSKMGSAMKWRVNIGNGIECGVVPDRFFGLELSNTSGTKRTSWYFLEADR